MTNPLEYVHIPLPEGGVFKISPSKFSNFIERIHNWYASEVSKTDVFDYNTSSVLGTIVHYCAEQVAKGEEVDKEVIEEYISTKEIKEDFDPKVVRDNYKQMAERLVNDYVHPNKDNFLEVEEQHLHHIVDGFYVGGTLDVLEGIKSDCMITDYKSYNSKTKPRTIPSHYKYQLLVYAFLLKSLGYNPTRTRLVYINRFIPGVISEKTGKRGKEYPPEVTVLTESITQEDIDFIENMIMLCVDTVKLGWDHPELLHIIYHDPRLRIENNKS